eukprot:scaffold8018_cov109-Isochrysis_galbana.AAC.3
MSYLDARALEVFQSGDADFRRASWSVYQNLHMCRLGVCPNWLWELDVFSLSTPTAIIHSCPICFNPQSTPPDQPIVMPVHPSHIPLAPMYPPPPDFDSPTSVIDTPTP